MITLAFLFLTPLAQAKFPPFVSGSTSVNMLCQGFLASDNITLAFRFAHPLTAEENSGSEIQIFAQDLSNPGEPTHYLTSEICAAESNFNGKITCITEAGETYTIDLKTGVGTEAGISKSGLAYTYRYPSCK